MRGNSHVRCGVGENLEITSKDYLSLYILPSDLVTYGAEAKNLLSELQNHDEKMFLITILFMNTSKSKGKLDNTVFTLKSIANRHNCSLKNLNYRQEQGLVASLPLGINEVEIERGLTTSAAAIFKIGRAHV